MTKDLSTHLDLAFRKDEGLCPTIQPTRDITILKTMLNCITRYSLMGYVVTFAMLLTQHVGYAQRPAFMDFFVTQTPLANDRIQDPELLYEAAFGGMYEESNPWIVKLGTDTIALIMTTYENVHYKKEYHSQRKEPALWGVERDKPELIQKLRNHLARQNGTDLYETGFQVDQEPNEVEEVVTIDTSYSYYEDDEYSSVIDSLIDALGADSIEFENQASTDSGFSVLTDSTSTFTDVYDYTIETVDAAGNNNSGDDDDYKVDYFLAGSDGYLVYCYRDIYNVGILKWVPANASSGWEIFFDTDTDIRDVVKLKDRMLLFCGLYGDREVVEVVNGIVKNRRPIKSSTVVLYFDTKDAVAIGHAVINDNEEPSAVVPFKNQLFLFYKNRVRKLSPGGKLNVEIRHRFPSVTQAVSDSKRILLMTDADDHGSLSLYCVTPDLKIKWRSDIALDQERNTSVTDLFLTSDGHALVTIKTKDGYQNERTAWSRLLKVGPDGATVWEHTMEGKAFEKGTPLHYIEKVIEGSDKRIYVLASSSSIGRTFDYFSLSCFTANGELVWRTFIGNYNAEYNNLIENKKGNIILVGRNADSFEDGGGLLTVIEKNKGIILKHLNYPAEDGSFRDAEDMQGSLMAVGNAVSTATGTKDYWILVSDL